jgi:hypothetical protein
MPQLRVAGDERAQGAPVRDGRRRLRLQSEDWTILDFLFENRQSLLVRVALAPADSDGGEDARWRPLQTARYDDELDEIELTVIVDRGAVLRYLLASPRCVVVEERSDERVLRVHDASGLETVIRVRERAAVDRSRDRCEGTAQCE